MPCSSPVVRTGLGPGDHAFVVTATGPDGIESATATWRVLRRRLLWGAWVYGAAYGFDSVPWDMRGLQAFEANAGATPAIVHFGQPWRSSAGFGTYHPAPYNAIRGHGSIPMVDWSPWDSADGDTSDQPEFALARIIAGDHDAYIRSWAEGAKAWGQPFFLRFAHEMNGTWYPWSERKNGNAAGEYVRAWRHVHDIFTAVGATNVTWVWCVNAEYPGSQPLAGIYPGDAYVDWVAVDGYNWGPATIHPTNWKTFDELFGPTYASLRAVAPTRPVMIAETASSETGGSKPGWIADAYARAASEDYAALGAIMWFNWNAGGDWQIETSPATTGAFRAALDGPAYPSGAPAIGGLAPVAPLPDA